MGVYIRKDSPFFWLLLEATTGPSGREATKIRHDSADPELRKENRRLAKELYHRRMAERARAAMPQPDASTVTLDDFAPWCVEHCFRIKQRQEATDVLPHLLQELGCSTLGELTEPFVRSWAKRRFETLRMIEHRHYEPRPEIAATKRLKREVEVLTAIVQAAVPKYLPASPLEGIKRLHTKAGELTSVTLAAGRTSQTSRRYRP